MEHETDVLLRAIESLAIGMEDGVIVSVLLNGGSDPQLKHKLSRFRFVRYYECPNNLGVAGGRVFLCNTKEFEQADVICILDNDVIVPRDYLRKMAAHLVSEKRTGVFGAVVLDIKGYYPALERFETGVSGTNEKVYDLTCEDARSLFLAAPLARALYHIGSHRDWFMTYLTPWSLLQAHLNRLFKKLGKARRFGAHLKDDTRYVQMIADGVDRFEVSNIAGCCMAFRRSLVDEIGSFDQLFNPYGLEDVDFNVRAIKAGYKNYTVCDVWLLHGTDTRHVERPPEKASETFYRVLTIFSFKHAPRLLFRQLLLLRIYCNWLSHWWMGSKNARMFYDAQMRGYRSGLRQLGLSAKLANTSEYLSSTE